MTLETDPLKSVDVLRNVNHQIFMTPLEVPRIIAHQGQRFNV